MAAYDLRNLLCMFDTSLDKLVKHLEAGYPDRALMRAKEMQRVVEKLKCHCVHEYHDYAERKL